jgi:hypothetical protein
MVELHVDEIPDNELLTRINPEFRFGGNSSVWRDINERPIFSFGQDKCIFHQFIFTGSSWTGPRSKE